MKIKLNSQISIDLDKLVESRLLVQANSGGGKSWAIRRIIEQAFGHVQIIVLDPEGEFSNLRSKFDFVYVGKGGDAPAEPRSAALLARRLLELKASAIVDLYELQPQERKHFVKLFCEAMVNAPKELWHDTLVIIDEAHVFAPEKGESEATGSVIDLATRGRKRGYCVVLATQRLPKLNKDAAAECNNKLIGRASQDIDRKRASEELGFTTKEQILSLRELEPGEFYAFGPAISREVIKTTIGDVVVKPAKRGVARGHVPAPSATVKKILAKLSDLPQEAQKEAQTVQELKSEVSQLKQKIRHVETQNLGAAVRDLDFTKKEVEKALKDQRRRFDEQKKKIYQALLKTHGDMDRALKSLGLVKNLAEEAVIDTKPIQLQIQEDSTERADENIRKRLESGVKTIYTGTDDGESPKRLSKGARAVLTYLHSVYPSRRSKTQCWVAAGYAPGGGFNNIIYELIGAGLIEKDDTGNYAALTNVPYLPLLGSSFDPSLSKWDAKLSAGARKVFRILLTDSDISMTKEELAGETGYALGGGFNNIIYELTGKELVKKIGTSYQINPEILDL